MNTLLLYIALLLRPIGTMLYLPSLPAITTYFNATQSQIQLSVAVFGFGVGITQIFYGALSDRIGRKKTLMLGLFLFTIGSIACIFASNITEFLIIRAIQGIGLACDCSVTCAIMFDLFSTEKSCTKIMCGSEITFGVSALIFPFIGGWIQSIAGWKFQFIFMASYTVIFMILAYLFLDETNQNLKNIKKFNLKNSAKEIMLFFNKQYIGCLLILFAINAFWICFGAFSPFIIQNILGYSAISCGNMLSMLGVMYCIGVVLCLVALKYFNTNSINKIGIGIYGLSSITLIFNAFILDLNIYTLMIPVLITIFASGFIVPNIMARVMVFLPSRAGLSGANIGITYYIGQAIMLSIISIFNMNSLFSVSIFLLSMFICVLTGSLLAKKPLA